MVEDTEVHPTSIRGRPKSGRHWKDPKERFTKVKKSIKTNTNTLKKAMALKNELKRIKELSNQIKLERAQENEMKRQRREENAKRRLENERKSEVVQIIKNPAKIKKMRKKQLRQIEKRDTSQM
ncbi:coiled-coil domain-containing protein 86 [Culicoides brevitarsis]|uniref:coiled-coil domain-containing protein 86 n=1 Tax=Culicoides brevitarsis TaxID=469753 RepID=UPI00307BAF0E